MLSKLIFIKTLSGDLVGSNGEQLFVEADNQVSNSFTTTPNNNYLAIGPISIAQGSVLTVADQTVVDFY